MNENTKMYVGLLAVGAVAYYLLMKSKKDASKVVASTLPPVLVEPPVNINPPYYEEPIAVIQTGPVNNMDGNFNAMQPIFKDYAGDPAGFFSSEKVKLNY
jgi:hypothetical protein